MEIWFNLNNNGMANKPRQHAAGDLEYSISIDLQLQRGFGKGLSSLANVTLKSPNKVVDVRCIENKKCEICRPELILHKPDNKIVLANIVEQDNRCLMTSEYIKMMSHADKKRTNLAYF